MTAELRTPRLLLRRWRDADLEPFAAINADPAVNEHLPAPLSRDESDALVARIEAGFEQHGFGLWAVEADGALVGFTGLSVPSFDAPFLPSVEIAWRLARAAWGRGYATEAATAVLAAAFDPPPPPAEPPPPADHGVVARGSRSAGVQQLHDRRGFGLREVVSFTAVTNTRSEGVMQRIGMTAAGTFEHPRLPAGHPLRRHVLYRAAADTWVRPPAAR